MGLGEEEHTASSHHIGGHVSHVTPPILTVYQLLPWEGPAFPFHGLYVSGGPVTGPADPLGVEVAEGVGGSAAVSWGGEHILFGTLCRWVCPFSICSILYFYQYGLVCVWVVIQ